MHAISYFLSCQGKNTDSNGDWLTLIERRVAAQVLKLHRR